MDNEDSGEDKASCVRVPTKLKPHVPNSRKVYIVLLWIALTHCLYNYTVFNLGGILSVGENVSYPLYVIGATQFFTLLLYPLGGIIGEVWFTRFNTLLVATIVMLLSLLAAPVLLGSLSFASRSVSLKLGGIFIAVFLAPFQIGLALFESNIIQFGTDQLLFASSDQLSNFVHWSFWCMYLVPGLVILIICPLNALFPKPPPIPINTVLVSPLVEFVGLLVILVVLFLPCTRKHLHISKKSKVNPVTLIYGVLKYAMTHKTPASRSAFTHNDEESHTRLNYAKKRFGGPYSTEQVEDVKTFGRMSVLFLSLFGFLLLDNTGTFVQQYTNLGLTKATSGLETISQCIVKNYGMTFYVILIGVPFHKLILSPFFYRFSPTMMKRMGLGLIVTCFSLALELALSVVLNSAFQDLGYVDVCGDNTTSIPDKYNITLPSTLINHYVLLVPQALNGFSLLLVFLTTLEFILAQSPRSMQGLLVGFWYALQSINVLNSTVLATSSSGCEFISYSVRLGLAVISICTFIVVSLWYKGRTRQESSLIMLKTIIENYTVRNLQKAPTATDYYGSDDYESPYNSGDYNLSMFSIYSMPVPQ